MPDTSVESLRDSELKVHLMYYIEEYVYREFHARFPLRSKIYVSINSRELKQDDILPTAFTISFTVGNRDGQ